MNQEEALQPVCSFMSYILLTSQQNTTLFHYHTEGCGEKALHLVVQMILVSVKGENLIFCFTSGEPH